MAHGIRAAGEHEARAARHDVHERGVDRLQSRGAVAHHGPGGHLVAAAEALRTTDSRTKLAGVEIRLPVPDGDGTVRVRVSGIAKGVGMIHPRMATMLSVVMTASPILASVSRNKSD